MKKAKKPLVKVSYATCTFFATFPMNCPACGVAVPANVDHTCAKPEGATR